MQGYNLSEAGHVVPILPPQNITGGVTTTPVNFKNAEHVSIIVQFGTFGTTAPTALTVVLMQSASASPATAGTAIPFRYYYQATPGLTNDLLSPPVYAPVGGITSFSTRANSYLIIEIDAAEITAGAGATALSDSNGADYPYVVVSIAAPATTIYASAVAVFSGVRQQYQGGVTATT